MIKLISTVLLVSSFAMSSQAAPSKKIAANKSPMKFAQAEEIDPVDAEVNAASAEQARGSSMITAPSMKSRTDYLVKGFGVGAFYQQMGLQVTVKYSNPSFGTRRDASKSDKDFKFAGLILRYGDAPLQGVGAEGSLAWGKMTNKSDVYTERTDAVDPTILRGEFNVVMSRQVGRESAMYGLVGGNLQQLFGNDLDEVFGPGIGIQGGGGYAITKNMNVDAVYFFNSQRITDKYVKKAEANTGSTVDRFASGLLTQGVLVRTTYSF